MPADFEYYSTAPLKSQVTYVIIERWPRDGVDWIHVDDQERVEGLIPSNLIFRRELLEDGKYLLEQGDRSLRVEPVLVEEVPQPQFWIDELVRLKSDMDSRKPDWGKVYEIRYNHYYDEAEFYLQRGQLLSKTPHRPFQLEIFDPKEREEQQTILQDELFDLPKIPLDDE